TSSSGLSDNADPAPDQTGAAVAIGREPALSSRLALSRAAGILVRARRDHGGGGGHHFGVPFLRDGLGQPRISFLPRQERTLVACGGDRRVPWQRSMAEFQRDHGWGSMSECRNDSPGSKMKATIAPRAALVLALLVAGAAAAQDAEPPPNAAPPPAGILE